MTNSPESASPKKRKIAEEKATVNKTKSTAWTAFSERLICALQTLEVGQWLILQKRDATDWVQFAVEGKGKFRMETKSNHYRELDQELTQKQHECLCRIGWREPTDADSTPATDPHGSPNYFLDLTLPRNASKLVTVTAATFSEVLGVVEPDGLLYEAYYVNGDCLSLSVLGLKPLISQYDNSQNPQLRLQLLNIIKELTGDGTLAFDDAGDIGPINFGCVSTFARLVEEQPYLRLYAPILDDVAETLELLSRVNEINCKYGFLHVCCLNDCVTVVSDILIAPFLTSYVSHGLGNFLQLADDFATQLREEFECYSPSNQRLLTH